jgi:hypothetical protein
MKILKVELEITTFTPQIDPNNVSVTIVCNYTGDPIAVTRNPSWKLYQYNYDMTIFEERYNVLTFIGGNAGLMYAK